jgi:hypothetical protein
MLFSIREEQVPQHSGVPHFVCSVNFFIIL